MHAKKEIVFVLGYRYGHGTPYMNQGSTIMFMDYLLVVVWCVV